MLKISWAVFMGLISTATVASALCLDGRHPSIQAEFAASDIVATGRIISKVDLSGPDDPEGIEKTIYSFKVVRGYKFARPDTILKIASENTTSRYEMGTGSEHLVFLKSSADELFVDACGNSGEAKKRRKVIRQLSSLHRQ